METSLSEYIGMAIVAVCLVALTAQTIYAYRANFFRGKRRHTHRSVQPVLDYENARKPKARKNKLKAARKSRVGSISLCV